MILQSFFRYFNAVTNCSSQPSLVHRLSSSIFPCLFVRSSVPLGWHPTKSPLFFNTYRHKSPIPTQYHLKPSSTKLYWPSTTKYQPVPPHTDPVPPNTNQCRLLLTQYYHLFFLSTIHQPFRSILTQNHQETTSTAPYWPTTPVL